MRRVAGLAMFIAALTVACSSDDLASHDLGSARAPVVYGTDDRTEPFAHPSGVYRSLAENAVAVLVVGSAVDLSDPDDVRIDARSTSAKPKAFALGSGSPIRSIRDSARARLSTINTS